MDTQKCQHTNRVTEELRAGGATVFFHAPAQKFALCWLLCTGSLQSMRGRPPAVEDGFEIAELTERQARLH